MNDILRHSRRVPAPAPQGEDDPQHGPTPEERARAFKRKARGLYHRLYNLLTGHALMAPLPFLAVAGLIGLSLVLTTIYTGGYAVMVNGTQVGLVEEASVFESVLERVEARATDILGYDYTFDGEVHYDSALIQKSNLSSDAVLETFLFDQIGEVMKSYVLTVNGKAIGSATDRDALDAMLGEIKAQYVNDTTVESGFVEDLSITYQYTASALEQDVEAIRTTLTSNTTGDTSYTVVKGDTYSTIAYRNDMSTSELMALNPQASLDRLMVGDVLTVKQEIPYLSVRTVDNVTYKQEIACPEERVEDSSMYTGRTKVLTAGTPGEAQVTANVTKVNGVEQSRNILSSVTLKEPTTRVVAVGTKARPKTLPTGSFQWPLQGRVTSNFGYRTIFGRRSFHSALDIAAPYGTAIHAADGGTVVWSGTGTGSYWSYGKYVVIDHGNGLQTYYAHCSSLSVSRGDKVYKGQVIGKVGQTGRATGNHCHFEVVINGRSVNPRSYLP